MKNEILQRLPVFYQNAEISEEQGKEEMEYDDDSKNFIDISFYQTKMHRPKIFYKPISKIWKLNEHG